VRSFISWLLQQVASVSGPFLALSMVESGLKGISFAIERPLTYAVALVASVVIAWLVAVLLPRAVMEGCWVWVIPTALFVAIGIPLYESGELRDLLWPTDGEQAWLWILLTIPTWNCCCYSATMWTVRHYSRPRPAKVTERAAK